MPARSCSTIDTMNPIRRSILVLATVLVAAGWLLQGLGQEHPPRRYYIPLEWQKLKLDKDQQQKLLGIRETYGKQLDALEFELSKLKAKEKADINRHPD